MSKAKHPKPYNKGMRKQMTPAWKRRVLERLEENRLTGREPANLDQLGVIVGAAKGGLNRTFDLKTKHPQTSSSYVDKICEVLGIDPPLQELNQDDERDVERLLALPPDIRRRVLGIGEQLTPKK